MTTHMAWRWNTTHELPKSRRACTDEADSTITRPTTTSALTSMASNTKSGVERERGGVRPCERFGAAPCLRVALDDVGRRRDGRGRVRPAVRVCSVAAGTGVLLEQLTDGASEVVTALAVRA